MKEIVITTINQVRKELMNDWLILKTTSLFVILADFAGLFKGLIGTYTFDIGVISAVVVMVFADVISGVYKSIKTATFDGKILGNGILRKILKYGVVILVLVQLMSMQYGGKPVEILQKLAFLFYVGIIGMELDSICGNLFGTKFSQILNRGVKTINAAKNVISK